MHLFSVGTFYLHKSSSVSAEWLCDKDSVAQLRHTDKLLATVVQMQMLARDRRLQPPDLTVYRDCADVCAWLHASAHNVIWMLDYFITLNTKCRKLFNTAHSVDDVVASVRAGIVAFDDVDTTTDWLLRPSEARAQYCLDVRPSQFRRVRPPFWLAQTAKEPSQTLPVAPAIPDDDDFLGLFGPV